MTIELMVPYPKPPPAQAVVLSEFSARLNSALDIARVPDKNQGRQLAVAKMFGVSQKGARKWLEGEGLPEAWRWDAIATRLNVRAEWLFFGRGAKVETVDAGPDVTTAVPLISWVQAGAWQEIRDNFEPGEGEKMIHSTKKVGRRAFALRVKGDSMENPRGRPSYPDGAVIIVDPEKSAKSGDRVIAKLIDSQEATFKKYVEDAGTGRTLLVPLNPDYLPPIDITNARARIVGVVVQTWIDEE